MASILNINGRWRAQVRRRGQASASRTFASAAEAAEWAAGIEQGREGDGTEVADSCRGARGPKLGEIFERALEDPRAGPSKLDVLYRLYGALGYLELSQLTAQDIIGYVERKKCGPATAQYELSVLETVLRIAELAWGYNVPPVFARARAALKLMRLVGKARERTRRASADELKRLCEYFDKYSRLPMRDLIWFSIHTTMRASEVTRLLWRDYNPQARTILVRERKSPVDKDRNDQEVPLLDAAVEIIERRRKAYDFHAERIFPYKSNTFSSLFPRACRALGIEDLHWHDLRHEGTSRLFEMGYDIPEVALFTGHKDWKMLRRYTHLKAKDLRRLRPAGADVQLAAPSNTRACQTESTSTPQDSGSSANETALSDKLVPGVLVEFVDKRARGHEHGRGLIVAVSQSRPRRYTVRIDGDTKFEHTKKLWAAQIVSVQ